MADYSTQSPCEGLHHFPATMITTDQGLVFNDADVDSVSYGQEGNS